MPKLKVKKEMIVKELEGGRMSVAVADYEKNQMFGRIVPKKEWYKKRR